MINRIENGDYVKSEDTGILLIEYIEAALQNVRSALECRRGEFYPDKNFGSKINAEKKAPYEKYALCYARQAVNDIDGVYIKSAEIKDGGAVFTVLINNEERQVAVNESNV